MARNQSKSRRVLWCVIAMLILLAAGPEIGIALELIGLIDAAGVGLVLMFSFAGFTWRFRVITSRFSLALQRIDPYFFVASPAQVRVCPALLAHAVPLFISFYLVSLVGTEIAYGLLLVAAAIGPIG